MGSPIDWTHFQTWKQYVENPNGTGYRKNVYICREGSNWYDGSILKQDGLAIDRTCTATNYLEMGNVAAAALTMTIVAPPLDISSWAVGQELEIQVDIFERTDPSIPEDGGSGTAYMGIFIIDSITERNGAYTIEALDRMVLLDTPMDWSGLVPPDIPSVLNKISTVYGITIATDITTLPNYFWAFAEFPKLTARQVVSAIAEVMGSCAFMDWNGELRFAWYAPILNANSSTLELTSDIAFSRRTDPQSYDLDAYGIGDPDGTKVEVTGPDECKYNLVGNALVETNRAAGILVTGIADNIQIARYTDIQFQGEYHYFAGGEYEVLPFPYIWPMDVLDVDGVFVPINHVVYRLNANMTLTASADPRISDYSTAFTSSQQTVLDRMESATDVINKHFFYTNATGAHITTTENDPDTGNNVLIDSNGLYVRNDTDVLAEFTANGATFTKYNGQNLSIANKAATGTVITGNGTSSTRKSVALATNDTSVTVDSTGCGMMVGLDEDEAWLGPIYRDSHGVYGNFSASVEAIGVSIAGGTTQAWVNADSIQLIAPDVEANGGSFTISDLDANTQGTQQLTFKNSVSPYAGAYIKTYSVDVNGSDMIVRSGGRFIAGGGEYASNRYNAGSFEGAEATWIGSDSAVFIESNGNTISSRNKWTFSASGDLIAPNGAVYEAAYKNETVALTSANLIGNGYAGASSIYIELPLPKKIAEGSSVNLTTFTAGLRGVNGTIAANGTNLLTNTTAARSGAGGLRLTITGQTTNFTANTPVSAVVANITVGIS